MLETNGTQFISANELADWMAGAKPGDSIVYARGDVPYSIKGGQPDLRGVQQYAYRQYLDERGHLTQRKRRELPFHAGGCSFDYILTVATPKEAHR